MRVCACVKCPQYFTQMKSDLTGPDCPTGQLKHYCRDYFPTAFTLQLNLIHTSKCVCAKCVFREQNTINRESLSLALRSVFPFHSFQFPRHSAISLSHADLILFAVMNITHERPIFRLFLISIYGPVD